MGRDAAMSVSLLLAHGDDSFRIDAEVRRFADEIGAVDRVEIAAAGSPDEAAIERAVLEAASVGMFGTHLAILRGPLRAAGRSAAAADKLLALVTQLPTGAALTLVEERPSREAGRPPPLFGKLEGAVRERGGRVVECLAPRRDELRAWIVSHAPTVGTRIEMRAAALLAERIGGQVWESDVERGEQTRLADGELRKLATYAGDRTITVGDVEALTADTRPASVFAITNAVDRREPAAAADALRRALGEGQPVLRITASLAGRVSDLIVARDLVARQTPPAEIAKRIGRGNARMAGRLVEAARRYRGEELEAMLRGLFEADLAIKANEVEPESALVAWLGEHLLARRRVAPRG
jgi:DNA polymerase III delta subunit